MAKFIDKKRKNKYKFNIKVKIVQTLLNVEPQNHEETFNSFTSWETKTVKLINHEIIYFINIWDTFVMSPFIQLVDFAMQLFIWILKIDTLDNFKFKSFETKFILRLKSFNLSLLIVQIFKFWHHRCGS